MLTLNGAGLRHLSDEDLIPVRPMTHAWLANVRELRSVLKSVIALAEEGDDVAVADLPPSVMRVEASAAAPVLRSTEPAAESLRDTTRHAIAQALEACGQDVAQAARLLGVHRSTVYRYLARRG